jgi:tetratricopeptide (TPR) repeat protein
MTWEDWLPSDRTLLPGFELWRSGELSGALRFFEEFLSDYPDDAAALRGYASVLWTQGRFDGALQFFQKAVRVDCWNPMHWSNLGLMFRELNRRPQAIRAFEVAVALDPCYEPAYNEWANVLFDEGRYADALALYEMALSMNSSRAVVHHNRGVCLRFMGDTDAAVSSFRKALEFDPTYSHTIQELLGLGIDIAEP